MKTIIAGSRKGITYQMVEQAVAKSGFDVTEVLSGKASGVDAHGELWAKRNDVPVDPYPADWDRYGRAAGPIRNTTMASKAEAAIIVWDGSSRGSRDMISKAMEWDLKLYVWTRP